MINRPHFIVGQKVVVFSPQNTILFLVRSPKSSRPNGWDFPGGGLERDETPKDGVLREAQEEAGLSLSQVRVVDTNVEPYANDRGLSLFLVGYMAYSDSTQVKLSHEHTHFEWKTVKEALKTELPIPHRKFLEMAIKIYSL